MKPSTKKLSNRAKTLGKQAKTSVDKTTGYKSALNDVSEDRLEKRENKRADKRVAENKKRAEQGKSRRPTAKPKKVVTSDNRAEVKKGSKASGVTVNNRLVRKGKVQAAEKAVKKAKTKAATKLAGKAAARVVPYAGTALLAKDVYDYAKSQPKRKSSKRTPASRKKGR